MASISDLIPEMASFMEDTDVDVKVEVGAPEAVEEAESAAEEATEVADAATESEETQETVEMVFRRMDELERLQAHIQKFGVSREFMSWHNYDGKFAASLGITVPSMESLDAIGDPNSSLSIACCESIGEAIKKGAKAVWDFIKKVCTGIANLVGRVIEWVKMKFGRLNPTIGRLKTAYDASEYDADKKDVEASFLTPTEIDKVVPIKSVSDNLSALSKLAMEAGRMADKIDEGAAASIMQFATKFGEGIGSGIRQFVDNLEKDKPSASKHKIGTAEWGYVKTYLDTATLCARTLSTAETCGKTIKQFSDSLNKFAKQAEQRKDDIAPTVTKAAKGLSSMLSECNTKFSKIMKGLMWCANQSLKSASIIINRAGKKK